MDFFIPPKKAVCRPTMTREKMRDRWPRRKKKIPPSCLSTGKRCVRFVGGTSTLLGNEKNSGVLYGTFLIRESKTRFLAGGTSQQSVLYHSMVVSSQVEVLYSNFLFLPFIQTIAPFTVLIDDNPKGDQENVFVGKISINWGKHDLLYSRSGTEPLTKTSKLQPYRKICSDCGVDEVRGPSLHFSQTNHFYVFHEKKWQA